MSNPIYDIYRNETYDLVESLIIKNSDDAYNSNRFLVSLGKLVDKENPRSWMYYMNLNGEYHPANPVMTTTSLDTRTTIQLTKDVLANHPKTKAALVPGQWLFKEVHKAYPSNTVLLKGLIYPVSPDVSIPAKDGTILAYNRGLVESNEENLIGNLEKEIQSIFNRWHVSTHRTNGELFPAAFYIQLTKSIIDSLFNLRQEAVHSNQVHSYHLWRFLASHGRLERYKPYLTQSQALWLYREVRYLVNNAGLDHTLQTLIDNLMTPRGIRVFDLDISQDTRDPKNPTLEISRNPRNYHDEAHVTMTSTTPQEVNERLSARVSGSIDDLATDQAKLEEQRFELQNTTVKTKALETFLPSYAELIADYEMTHLLRQWGYWALNGRYNAVIEVLEPKSGQTLTLTVRHAYQLYLAMIKKQERWPYDRYGKFGIPQVITDYRPTGGVDGISNEDVNAFLDKLVPPASIGTTAAFYQASMQQRNAIIDFDLASQQHWNSVTEAEYRAVIKACHRNVELPLGVVGEKEVDWLNAINVELVGYTADEARQLATDLLVRCTGIDTITDYDKDKIRYMMSQLIEELGSYHVRFVSNELDEAPLNARFEIPKAVSVTGDMSYKDIYIDLGYRYEAEHDPQFMSVIVPFLGEHIRALYQGEGHTEYDSLTDLSCNYRNESLVHYQYTTPPLVCIEDSTQ